MARRILGFAPVASHDLFPGERVCYKVYKVLQSITKYYKVLQAGPRALDARLRVQGSWAFLGGVLQSITKYHKVLQSTTKYYEVPQSITK